MDIKDIKQECDDNVDLSIVKEEFIIEEIEEEELDYSVVKTEETEILPDHDTKDNIHIKTEEPDDIEQDIKPTINTNEITVKTEKPQHTTNNKKVGKGKIDYKCTICGKVFQNSRNLRKHKLIHNENAAFKCDHCNKEFKVRKYLQKHLKRHTEQTPATCTICNKTFDNSMNLRGHMYRHKTYVKKRCHQCEICGKKYLSEQEKAEHIQKVHDKKPIPTSFTCTVCGKVYERKHCYENHLLIHSNIKFSCAKCPREFRRKDFLEKHLNLHVRRKLLICQICTASFTGMPFYRRHLATHDKKPATCFYCDKIFETTDLRYGHIKRNHPGLPTNIKDGRMICKTCNCNFENLEDFKKHSELNIHQRSYECCVCGEKFFVKEEIDKHMKSHKRIIYPEKRGGHFLAPDSSVVEDPLAGV